MVLQLKDTSYNYYVLDVNNHLKNQKNQLFTEKIGGSYMKKYKLLSLHSSFLKKAEYLKPRYLIILVYYKI